MTEYNIAIAKYTCIYIANTVKYHSNVGVQNRAGFSRDLLPARCVTKVAHRTDACFLEIISDGLANPSHGKAY